MTQEEKQLLLKDLCARLPYGVMVHFEGWCPEKLSEVNLNKDVYNGLNKDAYDGLEDIPIPYLRPMSSMTEEELNEFILISDTVLWLGDKRSTCILSLEQMDWLNAHHFDYRELIEKGLALEAPADMYKEKTK